MPFGGEVLDTNFGPTKPKTKGFRGLRNDFLVTEPSEVKLQSLLKSYTIPSPMFPRGPKFTVGLGACCGG